MVTSRQRVRLALDHCAPDRIPLDLGSSAVTGMHVSSVYKLRQALHLDLPETPVKVVEPYQMLGEIGPDLMAALGVDVVGLGMPENMFGYRNEGWKPWRTFDGTPVLVPEAFNTEPEPDGSILMYPKGDRTVHPSGRMPAGGFYFDSIERQGPVIDDRLNPADNMEEFRHVTDSELAWLEAECERLYIGTDKAILASFGGTAFGDIAMVPAPWLKRPLGIRAVEEWYISTITRREYVWKVFEGQCEVGLANLEKIHTVVGERVDAVFITGTDFGTQTGPFISPKTYRDLYLPFHRQVNDWVHRHTAWKTFIHSCGSISRLLPDFVEAGFDILNPVQTSAAGMDPHELKTRFGDRIVFWGGGVDTQHTLPFGTPEEIRQQVRERMEVFGSTNNSRAGGGFVFNTIHNLQAGVPVENIAALYEAVREYA